MTYAVPAADRYDAIGTRYADVRHEEPAWAAAIAAALGGARRVLDVGAGTGNYEPVGLEVVAVEPSATMLGQRAAGAAPAVRGVAEALPVRAGAFDAALAVLTVHHWADPARGLAELARAAPRQVVVTWDPAVSSTFWLHRDYLPELGDLEASQASLAAVLAALDVTAVEVLAVPRGCVDGFLGANWASPERYLRPAALHGSSGLALLAPGAVDRARHALRRDLDDGTWAARNAGLDGLGALDVGFRLVTAGREPVAGR